MAMKWLNAWMLPFSAAILLMWSPSGWERPPWTQTWGSRLHRSRGPDIAALCPTKAERWLPAREMFPFDGGNRACAPLLVL